MKVFILIVQLFLIICVCEADDLDLNNSGTIISPFQVTVDVEPLRSDCYRLRQRIYTPSHKGSCASLVSSNNSIMNVFIESMRVRGSKGGGGTCAFFVALPSQIRSSPELRSMYGECSGRMLISARFTEDNLCSFNNALKNLSPLEALRQTPFDKGLRKGLESQYRICDVDVDPTSVKVVYSVEPIGSAPSVKLNANLAQQVLSKNATSSSSAPHPQNCSPVEHSTKPDFSMSGPNLSKPPSVKNNRSVVVSVAAVRNKPGTGGRSGRGYRAGMAAGAGVGILGSAGQLVVNEWLEGKAQAGDLCAQDILESQRYHSEIVNNLSMGKTADGKECSFLRSMLHMTVNIESFMGM